MDCQKMFQLCLMKTFRSRIDKLEKIMESQFSKHKMTVKCVDGDGKIIKQYQVPDDKDSDVTINFGNGYIPPNL